MSILSKMSYRFMVSNKTAMTRVCKKWERLSSNSRELQESLVGQNNLGKDKHSGRPHTPDVKAEAKLYACQTKYSHIDTS